MLTIYLIDENEDDDNYVCHFKLDDKYEFQIMVPKYIGEVVEEDDEKFPFYLNLLSNEHYEG